MSRKIDYRIADMGAAIHQIQHVYENPGRALKEYISNGVDSTLGRRRKGDIGVVVHKPEGLIVIQDNGIGMSLEELEKLPISLFDSIKKGERGLIGEKGMGILAYPSCGAQTCRIYTRPISGRGRYNLLVMDSRKGFAETGVVNFDKIPFGAFDFGTKVILEGISQQDLERYFTPAKIKKLVSETFSPLLRKGDLIARVGYSGKRYAPTPVDPIEHKGVLFIDDVFEVAYENEKGEIEVLLYVDPKGSNARVGHFNKGVRVGDGNSSVSSYDLDAGIWASGRISGEIDENFVELNSPRNAPIRDRRYNLFVERLAGLEERLGQEIRKNTGRNERKELVDFGKSVLRTLDAVYREVGGISSGLVLGRKGDGRKNVIPDKDGTNGGLTIMGGNGNGGPKNPGRDLVKEDPQGEERPVRGAARRISGRFEVDFVDFDLHEENVRSQLDEVLGKIRINTGHGDYKNADISCIAEEESKRAQQIYIASLISKEVAYADYRKACQEGLIDPVLQAHNLTEVITGFQQRVLRLHDLL